MAATSKVGTAYAEYRFDLKGFRQDKAEILKGLREIQGAGKLPPIKFPKPNTAPIKAQGDAAERAAKQALTLAQAEASLLKAQGDLAGASNRLSQALQGVDRSSLSAIRAQTQLATINRQLAASQQEVGSSVGTIGPQMLQMAGAFGVVTSAAGAALVVLDQVKTGFLINASIDQSRKSLGAFLQDQGRANQAFADGSAFAEKYKIKQSEIAGALQSLAPLLRTSTTETEKQLEVLARLQSLNVKETFEGAAFAAKELASGDYVSLVERFNLGREAAQRLRDEVAAGADVFQVLDAELTKMGATVEGLNVRTQGSAGALNAMGKATEDLQLALGRMVDGPGAATLTFLAQMTQGTTAFIQQLSGQSNAIDQQAAALALTSQSYAQYQAQVQAAGGGVTEFVAQNQLLIAGLNGLLPGLGTAATQAAGLVVQTNTLSQSEYTYAQALAARGVAQEQAFTKAQADGAQLSVIASVIEQNRSKLGEYEGQLYSVAAAYDDGAARVATLLAAYNNEQITIGELQTAIANLEMSARVEAEAKTASAAAADEKAAADAAAAEAAALAAQASDDYTAAIALENEGLYENLFQKQQSELQTQRLADAQNYLASLGSQVASGLITAANAASLLAQRYGIAAEQARVLINLQATLARQEKVKAAGFAGVPEAYLGAAIGGRAGGSTQGPSNTVLTEIAEEGEAAAKRYEAAVADYEAAERRAAGGGGSGRRGRGGRARSGGAGRGGKSEAERAAEKAAKDAERQAKREEEERRRQLERLADLQRDHEEKILSIKEDYAKKQLEAEKRNNLSKLESRASFYDALTQAEASGDISSAQAQQLAASYEQAFAESQRLAQEGKAALAADYLALRQQQIQEELAYEQAVAAARAEGNEAEVRRLQQIEELKRQAREEELKQLLDGGDANQNARDEALKAENDRYIEQQAEILGVTEEVAAARVKGEQDAAAATAAGNLKLEERLRLMRDIAAASVGRETAAQQAAQQAAAPAAPTPTPTPQTTTPTLPTGEGGTAILVSDPNVAALLMQVVAVLETQGDVAGRGAAASEQAAAASREQVAETRRLADKVGRLGAGKGIAK